jgi:hypothetical protein
LKQVLSYFRIVTEKSPFRFIMERNAKYLSFAKKFVRRTLAHINRYFLYWLRDGALANTVLGQNDPGKGKRAFVYKWSVYVVRNISTSLSPVSLAYNVKSASRWPYWSTKMPLSTANSAAIHAHPQPLRNMVIY